MSMERDSKSRFHVNPTIVVAANRKGLLLPYVNTAMGSEKWAPSLHEVRGRERDPSVVSAAQEIVETFPAVRPLTHAPLVPGPRADSVDEARSRSTTARSSALFDSPYDNSSSVAKHFPVVATVATSSTDRGTPRRDYPASGRGAISFARLQILKGTELLKRATGSHKETPMLRTRSAKVGAGATMRGPENTGTFVTQNTCDRIVGLDKPRGCSQHSASVESLSFGKEGAAGQEAGRLKAVEPMPAKKEHLTDDTEQGISWTACASADVVPMTPALPAKPLRVTTEATAIAHGPVLPCAPSLEEKVSPSVLGAGQYTTYTTRCPRCNDAFPACLGVIWAFNST